MTVLIPVEGRRVLCPDTYKEVGPEGIKVNKITTYWHRRLASGDVVEEKKEPAPPVESGSLKKSKKEKKAVKPKEGEAQNGDLI